MTPESLANAFNKWMEIYLQDRSKGDALSEKSINQFKADIAAGKTPRYGMDCVIILNNYGADFTP